MRALPRLAALGPLLLGVSRKRFLGAITGRDAASDAGRGLRRRRALLLPRRRRLLRVHDVRATADALAVERALEGA